LKMARSTSRSVLKSTEGLAFVDLGCDLSILRSLRFVVAMISSYKIHIEWFKFGTSEKSQLSWLFEDPHQAFSQLRESLVGVCWCWAF
jgi:hypothetical protein